MVSFYQQQVAGANGAVAGHGQSPGGQSSGGPFWAWVGAHGGAGVTTLAEVVPGGNDFGRDFPAEVGAPDLPAVVVCRSNAQGLVAARKAALRAVSFGTDVLGLVVVADVPERKRPKPLAEALYLTRGGYKELWEMPWVPAWRFGQPPAPANSPRQVRELLVALWTALDLPLPGGKSQKRQGDSKEK
jgi:hypothetical protein